MRRLLLLLCAFGVLLSFPTAMVLAGGGDDDGGGGEILRRSNDPNPFDNNPVSYPGGPTGKAPLATGYYVADNDAPVLPSSRGVNWTPTYSFIDTTGSQASSWRRILSGPNQAPSVTWTLPGSQGYEYFRNPDVMGDSTDNAIAGPIAIGFPFYYYCTPYDSFYVSTNGLIGLSNRRYQYDESGRVIAYNPNRIDPRPTAAGGAAADTIPDDYGYKYLALGNTSNPLGGYRNPNNTAFPNNNVGPAIAPLWDDTELSQFDTNSLRPDDFGRVYWRRDLSGTKLIIYFVNQSMKGNKHIPLINQTLPVSSRLLRANYQVVLDRSDSSVQFNYVRFTGNFVDPTQGIFTIPSNTVYRANATIGIQSKDLEYTNYNYNHQFEGSLYVNGDDGTPHNALAIKFKQWKNITRVLSVSFQVPDRNNPGEFVDLPQGQFPDNFEVLLGNPTLGVVRPIGIVQNVSDSIGPNNVTAQPIRFNVVFRIRDLVNTSAQPVYQKTKTTNPLTPIRVNKNTSIDTVVFDPYVTNAQLVRELGRFRAEVIATDRGPTGQIYGDFWPFDDTTGVLFFGISRQEVPYISTFSDFDVSDEDGIIPSVKRWVSIGGHVVDGDLQTWNPPPPRGPATSNDGRVTLNSPVLELDRVDVGGAFYNNNALGVPGGDTLISFPVNLSTTTSPVLILSYERSGRQSYPRNWSQNQRLGPEHATYNTLKTGVYQQPDVLMVEFAEPSPNGVDNIVNVRNWRDRNFNDKDALLKWGADSPRWGVFGGGGGSGADTTGKIVVDEYDSGKDFEFYRAYIPIPSRWWDNVDANKYFRFRLRVSAKNDQDPLGAPADDKDAFYVDNIMLTTLDKPEVEVTAVGADWPYSIAPASQARAIPLWAKVSNNGATAATSFGVAMTVTNTDNPPPPGNYSYYRYQTVISLGAGLDRIEEFPAWNAQECGNSIAVNSQINAQPVGTNYKIAARILPQGYDSYNSNDQTYTNFRLMLGTTFAYDDTTNRNDVPNYAGLTGKGLNLVPPTQDGNGQEPYGPTGGSLSGSFATQFRLLSRDTIRGFQAYYSSANQAPDFIQYAIYKQYPNSGPSAPPDTIVTATRVIAQRGQGIPETDMGRSYHFDQYVTYLLPQPYVANPGRYYVAVEQLGQTGIELGGDDSRMGQVTTVRSDGPPPGIGNFSVPAYPEMREDRFWYEINAESGSWQRMITTVGNPGFPFLDWTGTVTIIPTYTRGSWIPMIRPYFGMKPAGDCTVLPVELSEFNLTELASAIRLDWRTETEVNNNGFHVQRRVAGTDGWSDIAFKQGVGTSNRPTTYFHVDDNVVPNTTYQYRLRQEDRDGSVTYSKVLEGRIDAALGGATASVLEQNTPNPLSTSTDIGFRVEQSGPVSIEIVDMYGRTIRAFHVDAQAGTHQSVTWDGTDVDGNRVANGVYIYKLVGNGFTLSNKLTVAR